MSRNWWEQQGFYSSNITSTLITALLMKGWCDGSEDDRMFVLFKKMSQKMNRQHQSQVFQWGWMRVREVNDVILMIPKWVTCANYSKGKWRIWLFVRLAERCSPDWVAWFLWESVWRHIAKIIPILTNTEIKNCFKKNKKKAEKRFKNLVIFLKLKFNVFQSMLPVVKFYFWRDKNSQYILNNMGKK